MAHIETYRTVALPKVEDPYQKLIKQLTGDIRMHAIPRELRGLCQTWHLLMNAKNRIPILARLPYNINIY